MIDPLGLKVEVFKGDRLMFGNASTGINIVGDLNSDLVIDVYDIDMLFENLGSAMPMFDLNGDSDSDQADVDELVLNILDRRFGDTDLDGDIDIVDFNGLANNFDPMGAVEWHGWGAANFDGDADVDISDFRTLLRNF